jgi:hypothetical protein
MKQIGKLLFISYIFLAMSQSAYAQEQTPLTEPESGGIVCEHGVYL